MFGRQIEYMYLKKCSFLRSIVFKFVTLSSITLIVLYINQTGVLYINFENNYTCHYLKEGDALPRVEDIGISFKNNSIFFHETSCRGGLEIRQACVIESAARIHPKKQIYVLFSAPVSKVNLKNGMLRVLQLRPNIKLARIHIEEYAKNTPLEELISKKTFYKSHWWVEHTSDVLRTLTFYKWGGVYLDTDMLVVKSLTPLGHNWVAKETGVILNPAAIAVSMNRVGRKLAHAIIHELKINYRPDIWIHNGPGAVTRVLHRLCNTHHLAHWSPSTCGGLQVYGPEFFYPVHYSRCRVLFEAGELNNDEQQAYAYHLWNKLTYNMTVEKDSPFMKLAEKYCPTIFQLYSDQFGSIDV